jgi:prophage regulatory protein
MERSNEVASLQAKLAARQEAPGRLMRLPEVRALTSLSTATIYRLMDDGTFPQSVKLSKRATAWLESEVTAWIAERVSASRQPSATAAGSRLARQALPAGAVAERRAVLS